MKRALLLFMVSLAFICCKGQMYYSDSYYITLEHDTVRATIIFSDILEMQHELKVVGPDGTNLIFHPGEIAGFGVRARSPSFDLKPDGTLSDLQEVSDVERHGVKLGWNYPARSAVPVGMLDNELYFEGFRVGELNLFLHVWGGKGGELKRPMYYYNRKSTQKGKDYYYFGHIEMLARNQELIDYKSPETFEEWIARAIEDYPELHRMVLKRKFNVPNPMIEALTYIDEPTKLVNTHIVVNEYNRWVKNGRTDSFSLIIQGVRDADKYYRTWHMFLFTTVGTTFYLAPGVLIGGLYLRGKVKVKLPPNCSYCANQEYLEAYQMRARRKRQKAVDNGWLLGTAAAIIWNPLHLKLKI